MFLCRMLMVVTLCSLTGIASADVLTLQTGDTLRGTIVSQSEESVVINHPDLGELTIPRDRIASVLITEDVEAVPAADGESAEGAAPAPAAPTTAPAVDPLTEAEQNDFLQTLSDWNVSLELGFTGSAGNSETLNFYFRGTAGQETDDYRFGLGTTYFLNTNSSETTKNELTMTGRYDWLLPDSDWFYFADGRYQYDQFQSWDHRLSGFGGVGYDWIKREHYTLSLRAGAGVTYDIFRNKSDELTPEGLLGAEMGWQITENQKLAAGIDLYPSLDEFPEFRTIAYANWQLKMPDFDGISIKLGVENEYDSKTEGDAEHNDVKVYGALVVDF